MTTKKEDLLIKSRLRLYMGEFFLPLPEDPSLKDKLFKIGEDFQNKQFPQSLIIQCQDETLCRQITSVLILSYNKRILWKALTFNEIIERSFRTDSTILNDIKDLDLLIIWHKVGGGTEVSNMAKRKQILTIFETREFLKKETLVLSMDPLTNDIPSPHLKFNSLGIQKSNSFSINSKEII